MKSGPALAFPAVLAVLTGAGATDLAGEDVFLRVPLRELGIDLSSRPSPAEGAPSSPSFREFPEARGPRVSIEGPGEAYIEGRDPPSSPSPSVDDSLHVVLRLPEAREVKGRLHVPGDQVPTRAFKLPPAPSSESARKAFLRTQLARCESLTARGVPGAAWFRHEGAAARRALEEAGERPDEAREGWFPRRPSELEDTYLLFSGGRAISENLQLDRILRPTAEEDLSVDVSTLGGITTAAMDWKALIEDLKPEADPLASCIPHDQHAIFFPSFQAMVDALDDADAHGTPVLELVEVRSEDARTRARYEKQLALEMSDIARLLGPAAVESVAFTGSDPYLRTGSDVAILFHARLPEALKGYVASKHAAAVKAPGVTSSRGDVEGLEYTAAVSADRSVSSYLLVHEKTVVVTNSPAQLRLLAEVLRGRRRSLASSEEYIFFRDRYRRGDPSETAFLILTDATIRRWCGPLWRIADSRRTRVAAVLADLRAAEIERRLGGSVKEGPIETGLGAWAGGFRTTERGPVSETYGSLDFLTPIAELSISKVTKAEAETYERFRQSYQRNWRQFFDPIAVRLTSRPDRLAADITVMPLIEGTEYRELIQVTRGVEIPARSGDPHPEAIFQVIAGIDKESEPVKSLGSFAASMMQGQGGLRLNPLGWLGKTVSFYADDGPVWAELSSTPPAKRDLLLHRFPFALRCDVEDPLAVTAFLATLRAFIEGSAPGMTRWETLSHREMPYVKVSPSEAARAQTPEEIRSLAVYYAARPGYLVLTLDEELLRRALDREAAGPASKDSGEPAASRPEAPAWVGKSVAARISRKAFEVLTALDEDDYQAVRARRSWDNLPILNEWKRLFPSEDPVKLHERLWGTRLVCPGGGAYVWNEEQGTMESTAYGHPGGPRKGPAFPAVLERIAGADFGLTFEKQGLRAAVDVRRTGAVKP